MYTRCCCVTGCCTAWSTSVSCRHLWLAMDKVQGLTPARPKPDTDASALCLCCAIWHYAHENLLCRQLQRQHASIRLNEIQPQHEQHGCYIEDLTHTSGTAVVNLLDKSSFPAIMQCTQAQSCANSTSCTVSCALSSPPVIRGASHQCSPQGRPLLSGFCAHGEPGQPY